MTRFLRRIFAPRAAVPPLPYLIVAASAVLATVLLTTIAQWSWRPEWPRTSAATHEALLFVAPVAAVMSFGVGATILRRGGIFALRSSYRSGLTHVIRLFRILSAWMVSAYILGLLPLFIKTAVTASYGRIQAFEVAVGIIGLTLAVTLGLALSTLAPRVVFAPLAGIVTFLLLQSPNFTTPKVRVIVPVQGVLPRVDEYVPVAVSMYRILTLAALVLALLLLASAVHTGGTGSVATFGSAALCSATVVALVALALSRPPSLLAAEREPQRVCEEVLEVQVCVHRGHMSDLAAVSTSVEAVVMAYGGAPPHLRAVHDVAAATSLDLEDETVVTVPIFFDDNARRVVLEAVAQHLAGVGACLADREQMTELQFQDALALVSSIAAWLLDRSSVSADVGGQGGTIFEGWSDREVHSWLQDNAPRIATCAVEEVVRS